MDKSLHMQGTSELTPERAQFITKVYGLLTLAVVSTIAGGLAGAQMFSIRSAGLGLNLLGLLALIVAMVFRKVPGLNLALLFGFTFIDGMVGGPYLAYLSAHGYGSVVVSAAGTTLGTFGALTAYVFWSKTDFSYLKGFLWAGLWALILVGFFGYFISMGHMVHMLYLYAGVLIFVGYVLYDTSNIIHHCQTDETVHATLMLFLDLINLFWFILQIFMSRDRN